MDELRARVEVLIASRKLIPAGARVLVAVSGGVDSMVLLHVLRSLSAANGWRLVVGHFNHKLRGRSSEADERLVARAARRLRLPLEVDRADVRKFAREQKLSLEMAGRELRHEFLARAATRRNCALIALAQHADDQVELFFLRLLRGSGIEGLAGMKWRNLSPANAKVEVVRPLLNETKEALREYARANRISFREDASNASADFARNRIRGELLPLLRKRYQPALARVVLRLMEVLRGEADLLNELSGAWLSRALSAKAPLPEAPLPSRGAGAGPGCRFEELPVAVQRHCIYRQLLEGGATPDFEVVEQLRNSCNQRVNLAGPRRLWAIREATGRVSIQEPEASVPPAGEVSVQLSSKSGQAELGNLQVTWRVRPQKGQLGLKASKNVEYFDADRVGSGVVLRYWRPGDRFQPIGMSKPLKLQDFFTNAKIPRERRRELVLAATAGGEVFWVEGVRIAERFKLTAKTIRRLQWAWERL